MYYDTIFNHVIVISR